LPSSGAGPRASLDPATDPKTFGATIPSTARAIPAHTLCGRGEEKAAQQKDPEQEDGAERLEEQNEQVALARSSSLPSRRKRAGGRMAELMALLSSWSVRRPTTASFSLGCDGFMPLAITKIRASSIWTIHRATSLSSPLRSRSPNRDCDCSA
jgi:hypothetical protein